MKFKAKRFKAFLDFVKIKKNRIHKKFDFRIVNSYPIGSLNTIKDVPNCGTFGCMAGELPGFDKLWSFNTYGELRYKQTIGMNEALQKYFGLSQKEVEVLFYPKGYFSNIKYYEKKHISYMNEGSASFRKVYNTFLKFYKDKNEA